VISFEDNSRYPYRRDAPGTSGDFSVPTAFYQIGAPPALAEADVGVAQGFAAWLLFLWAVKSDQYDDVERPKHRMLDDDDEVRDTDGESRRGKERTDESRRV